MHPLRSVRWLLALAIAAAGPAFAAQTFEVKVGPNNTLTFSPKNLPINKGDSVKFINQGGFHNVVADNGAWKCANGCSDQGGNGDASGALWSFTRTFNNVGTVAYHCEIHGAAGVGMAGTIVVNDVAPPPPPPTPTQNIVPGLSGNWANPTANQGGHGFQIEILPNNTMLAIWFVFNPAGTAQNWIFALGTYSPDSNDAVIPAVLEQGGAFPPNFDSSHLTQPAWGVLEFKFADCANGTAEYTPNEAAVNAGYGHVSFPIQRVTSINGMTCP